MEALATAGAFDCFGADRRDALWAAGAAATARPGQLDVETFDETAPPQLAAMTEPEQLIADLWATGITPDAYPTALIRDRLDAARGRSTRSVCARCPTTPGSRWAGSSRIGSARPLLAGSPSSTSRTRRAW